MEFTIFRHSGTGSGRRTFKNRQILTMLDFYKSKRGIMDMPETLARENEHLCLPVALLLGVEFVTKGLKHSKNQKRRIKQLRQKSLNLCDEANIVPDHAMGVWELHRFAATLLLSNFQIRAFDAETTVIFDNGNEIDDPKGTINILLADDHFMLVSSYTKVTVRINPPAYKFFRSRNHNACLPSQGFVICAVKDTSKILTFVKLQTVLYANK